MKRWRNRLFGLFAAFALFAACSGRSDDPEREHGGPSEGDPSEGGEAGEPTSGGASGDDRTGGAGGRGGGTSGFAGAGASGASDGTSGFAGAGASGASDGTPIAGGSGRGPAGTGGTGGAGVGGSGTDGVPFSWACGPTAYGDGVCDCGCTAPDIDCADGDIDTCEVCDRTGSCNGAPCPGRIEPGATMRCQPVPVEWRCSTDAYADESTCHCGCGTVDPDCPNDSGASCDVCNLPGSCALGSCPSAIDPDENSSCRVPRGWTCIRSRYGDGSCDCGCGDPDLDCESSSVEDCDDCSNGCSLSACPGSVAPDSNAFCTSPPVEWACSPLLYNDGSSCDCGCGAIDLDCESVERASCDRCNVEGSCSGQSCPGLIDPEFNGECIQPEPPPGWTCSEVEYGDGTWCTCGCGVLDADCRANDVAECDDCRYCGTCPGRVDPSDISKCIPPPAGWHCEASLYGDTLCDCGCGIRDPDCASGSRTACDTCNVEGSCSTTTCPGTISTNDNALCQ